MDIRLFRYLSLRTPDIRVEATMAVDILVRYVVLFVPGCQFPSYASIADDGAFIPNRRTRTTGTRSPRGFGGVGINAPIARRDLLNGVIQLARAYSSTLPYET
jgi:hypothetical protein